MKHTPGPWTFDKEPGNSYFEVRSDGRNVAAEIKYLADARLMAAAPELLALLKQCQRQRWSGERQRTKDPLLAAVTAVIQKAEGAQ